MIDIQLYKGLIEKDKTAFKIFFDKYKNKITKTTVVILKNSSNTDDVVQEVFLKVYQKIHTLNSLEAFDVWIYRITVNTCRKYLRNVKKEKEVLGKDISQFEDVDNIPEEILMKEDFSNSIKKYIYQLPENQRLVMVLYYYNNMTIKEVANVMECSEGTVKSRLYYGKRTLKDRLIENHEEVGIYGFGKNY